MEQGEIETSPDLHHSPDIEILPDDETVDLTLDERRRGSDSHDYREDNEESLHIKPPQVHVSKRDKHKHKHKDDRKKDRERERDRAGRHGGEREKDRGKHKDRRGEKDKVPKESHEERLAREAREREREHERERYRRKELEAEAKRREKSQRERDRLERLERERRKLEREREQREREHRERLKQEQDRQERLAKVEREQERLAKAEREQERLAEAEQRYAKEYERKVVEHVVKAERHRGSSEREYDKDRGGRGGERNRRRGGGEMVEEGRKAHSTRHELERRRDKDRAPRPDRKEAMRERSRSPYGGKKVSSRVQHQYGQRQEQRYHRHRKEDPTDQDELDHELERTYHSQQVAMEMGESDHGEAAEAESEAESSSATTSESDSEDSDSDSQSERSAGSPHSVQEAHSHSEGEMSPHDHRTHAKSKFDDDDDDREEYDDGQYVHHRHHHHRRRGRRHSHNEDMYDENDADSLPPSRPHSDEEKELEDEDHGEEVRGDSDYAASTPPESPVELASRLPPYLPAIQGCRNVEEFHCLNRIEEGTYGVVYRARDNKTGELVALKRLKMEKEKEGFPITSLREINTLLKAQHPNIVTVREIVVGSNMDKIYIVMDYVEHDLKSLMQTMKDPFTIGEVKTLMQQLLRGVAHLHDNWIIHRDLKTSNLLLSHNAILKIGDFGLAREYGSPLKPYTAIVVTLWYRSPELLLGIKEYSTYIDMWSVGCIFAEFLTMKPLFPGKSEIDQLNRIFKELGTPNEKIWPGVSELPVMKKCTFAEYPYNQLRKRFSSHLSDRGFDLMNRFLMYDPQRRLTAKDALDHDHFVESPLPVPPSMFPTWPAKSEQTSRTHANTPRPPSGGKAYDKLLGDDDDALAAGFHIGSSTKGSAALGFKLKF